MTQTKAHDFDDMYAKLRTEILVAPVIKSGRWQSRDVSQFDALATPELIDLTLRSWIPETIEEAQQLYRPNLPWAEEHFQERVSGNPTNPGDTYYRWPWYKGGVEDHKREGFFSHTYQERIWPSRVSKYITQPKTFLESVQRYDSPLRGIRYAYGNLDDVVDLLVREPLTRQAYLPIWFPEDTGVVHGERVPCSIGYQFLIRRDQLHVIYTIRSCDFVRYLRDDIYLAARLGQWVRDRVLKSEHILRLDMGGLTMHIGSLHCFCGDLPKLKKEHEAYVSNIGSTN